MITSLLSQPSDQMNSREMNGLRALCGQDVRAPREALS